MGYHCWPATQSSNAYGDDSYRRCPSGLLPPDAESGGLKINGAYGNDVVPLVDDISFLRHPEP